jgi:predicted amidohydrolase YtcJ
LDEESGSIEVGKAADIILLDKNLFELPAHAIHTAKVTHTFVDGNLVYKKDLAC